MAKIEFYKKQIESAIKSKLVIENKESIHYAVNEIAELMSCCYWDGYDDGRKEEQNQATEEIHKNYRPIR